MVAARNSSEPRDIDLGHERYQDTGCPFRGMIDAREKGDEVKRSRLLLFAHFNYGDFAGSGTLKASRPRFSSICWS